MFVNGVSGRFSSRLVFTGVKANAPVKVKSSNLLASKSFSVIGVYHIWKSSNRFFVGVEGLYKSEV